MSSSSVNSTHQTHNINEPIQFLYAVLNEALSEAFSKNEKIQEYWLKLKHGEHDKQPNVALNVLRSVINTLIKQNFTEIDNRLEPMRKSIDSISSMLAPIMPHMERIDSVLRSITDEQFCDLLMGRQFLIRYNDDFHNEKKELGKYVAKTFFSTDRRSYNFIQASTTAIHLAQELRNYSLPMGSLVVTNSSIIPVLLLPNQSHFCVYSFSTGIYDEMSGGWLLSEGDSDALNYVDNLFNRSKDPIDTVFLTPIAMTPSSGPMFHGQISVLTQRLYDLAPKVVIMVLAERLHKETPALVGKIYPNETIVSPTMWNALRSNQASKKEVIVVVTGKMNMSDREDHVRLLLEQGVKEVHWYATATEEGPIDPKFCRWQKFTKSL